MFYFSCKKEIKPTEKEQLVKQESSISENLKTIVKCKLLNSDYLNIDWNESSLKIVPSTDFKVLELPFLNGTKTNEVSLALISFRNNEEFLKGQIIKITAISLDSLGQINGNLYESNLDRNNETNTELLNGRINIPTSSSSLSMASFPQTYISLAYWYYLLDMLGVGNGIYTGVNPIEPSGGGGGSGGSSTTTYSYNCLYLTNILQLPEYKKIWLNNHPVETEDIMNFLEESKNIDLDEDPLPPGYIPYQALNTANAIIEASVSFSLYSYDEPTYNAIKQFAPTINGTILQQSDIFWSNFSFHSASSADINPTFTPTQHYLYAFSNLYNSNLNNSATGLSVANLNTNYFQTVIGQGLNSTFVNQSQITLSTPLDPKEFKRKTLTNPLGKKIDIVWYKDNVTNKISFGDRKQLRELLNITNPNVVAHHIIPVGVCNGTPAQNYLNFDPAIQLLGSKGDFHMNQIENGIPNNTKGDNPTYTTNVRAKLTLYWNEYISNGSTATAYAILKTKVFALITQIKALLTNPNTNPNNLVF